MTPTPGRSNENDASKLRREVRNLEWGMKTPEWERRSSEHNTSSQIQSPNAIEIEREAIETEVHHVFNVGLSSDPGEPTTVAEALSGPEAELWANAIAKEFMNLIKRNGWQKVDRAEAKKRGKK